MNKSEIEFFIEEMGAIGDMWSADEVVDVYGDYSLEDALDDRKAVVDTFLESLANLIAAENE